MFTIASWNVNGIRAAAGKGMLGWLASTSPDIACIQETKAAPDQLAREIREPKGYLSLWESAQKRGYSGLGIYTKKEPLSITNLGVIEFDCEGRVQIARFKSVTVINAYFPNSQEAGARLGYKLKFCDALYNKCEELRRDGHNLVICGDYNIAHTPIDLANPKSNEKNPGYLPEERAWMSSFLAGGYVDTFRIFTGGGGHYSWWSYRFHAREKDIGWRIDYHCVNKEFSSAVKQSVILKDIRGSDHCPVLVTLK
jgi:exodeoxyribonuclease-3